MSSSRMKTEQDLRLNYFGHVFADYHRLPKTDRDELTVDLPSSLKALVGEVDKTGDLPETATDRLEWGEIATLEDKILSRQDPDTLRRRAWQIRSRYELLVGPDRFRRYIDSGPPNEKDSQTSPEKLRADLRRVLGATHFGYSFAMIRENSRRRVMKGVGKLTLWIGLVVLLIGAFADWWSFSGTPAEFTQSRFRLGGTLLAVVLFGCLGAYLSISRRLQQSPDVGDPVIAILGLHEFNCIKLFPLISGGLFAVVLYFILAAGFMQGELFPGLSGGIPNGLREWAKLFIWAFLAGFAERLVPDTLDRLVNQAQPKAVVVQSPGSNGHGGPAPEPRKEEEPVTAPKPEGNGGPGPATVTATAGTAAKAEPEAEPTGTTQLPAQQEEAAPPAADPSSVAQQELGHNDRAAEEQRTSKDN